MNLFITGAVGEKTTMRYSFLLLQKKKHALYTSGSSSISGTGHPHWEQIKPCTLYGAIFIRLEGEKKEMKT